MQQITIDTTEGQKKTLVVTVDDETADFLEKQQKQQPGIDTNQYITRLLQDEQKRQRASKQQPEPT